MAYMMWQTDLAKIRIQAKNFDSALKVLQKYEDEHVYGAVKPQSFDSLETALIAYGWIPYKDERGDITDLSFDQEYQGDEANWLNLIAPFVEPGSHIDMAGEDLSAWRWYFDGKTMTSYQGQVYYPDCPDTGLS